MKSCIISEQKVIESECGSCTADSGRSGQTDCEFHCTETNQVFVVSCSNCDAMLSIAVIRYMNQSRALCGQYLLPVWSEFACVS